MHALESWNRFLVCCAILRESGEVSQTEWSLLLRGAGLTENPVLNPEPTKIKEAGWNLLHVLQEQIPDKFGLSTTLIFFP